MIDAVPIDASFFTVERRGIASGVVTLARPSHLLGSLLHIDLVVTVAFAMVAGLVRLLHVASAMDVHLLCLVGRMDEFRPGVGAFA